jgi:hypothetical protein
LKPEYHSGIMTSVGIGQPRNCGLIPGRGEGFSLRQNVQTRSGGQLASSSMGTKDTEGFSSIKAGTHLSLSGVEVKNEWS